MVAPAGVTLIEHPFAPFVQRRGGRVGTRFKAAFIRVGEPEPYYVGEVMLAGGGNPLQSGMWVKFWFDDDSTQHPFDGCTPRSADSPGDLFDAAFVEIDSDDSLIDEAKRERAERFAQGVQSHTLARYAAMLGTNELFLQWMSETVTFDQGQSTRTVEWWKTDDHVARWIRWVCKVESRSDLDRNHEAAQLFHQKIREPYNKWRHMHDDER